MEASKNNSSLKFMGGVGLRSTHYPIIESALDHKNDLSVNSIKVDWFEALSENYIQSEGRPMEMLLKVREHFPVALHGVSLSIAAPEEINLRYLSELKKLYDRVEPFITSDHMCWTGHSAHNAHDLLPFPRTKKMLQFVSDKIDQAQNFLERTMTFENVSTYVEFDENEMSEDEFLSELSSKTGCRLLVDINNIYVNATNFSFSPQKYIDQIDASKVSQIHLAGFSDLGEMLFDTHSKPVFSKVWELYRYAAQKLKDVPVLIEWDEDIPEFSVLCQELEKARNIWNDENCAKVNHARNEKTT